MRKKSIFMFLVSLFTILAGFMVSCSDEDTIIQATNLEVTPSDEIHFKVDGNENVVLLVKTDADEWSFEKSEWLTAKKEGDKLIVNTTANTLEAQRPGRVTVMSGTALPVKISVLQDGVAFGETSLSVTPADDIAFNAADNAPVELTVDTNAADFTVTVPEWVNVAKEEAKIILTATDNTGDARLGMLVVKTDDGAKEVKIGLKQKGVGEAPDNTDKLVASLKTEEVSDLNFDITDPKPLVKKLTISLDKASETETKFNVIFDEKHIEDYNFNHSSNYELYPVKLCSFENNGEVTIPAGATSATVNVTVNFSNEMSFISEYMVPVKAVPATANVTMKFDATYVEFFMKRTNNKKIRNICYFEVNDCNPLNAIEYILEDGRPFFDAIVLFAGNINWDRNSERVIMHANPNVQALLDGTDTFLQPLRKKGIKVLLGILGNHDAAGLAGLTEYGCEQFGMELAGVCRDFKLDGVAFDDEYSSYGGRATDWFIGGTSQQAAARLCYETKKAMRQECTWETWVHLYYLGNIWPSLPSVTIDGVEHLAGEFVDNVCSDYGQPAAPVRGMDKSGCAGTSIQLNTGQSGELSMESAQRYMEEGYGWIMWFAFDPSGTGSVYNNLSSSLRQFNNMAKGCYNQRLREPKYKYDKIRPGEYDATPHPIK